MACSQHGLIAAQKCANIRQCSEKRAGSFAFAHSPAQLAQMVGFEPTCPCGQLDFESSSLWPLRYICKSFIYWFLLYQNSGKNASAFLQNHKKVRKNSAKMGFFGEICPKYLTLYGKSNRIRITIVREFFLHEVFF